MGFVTAVKVPNVIGHTVSSLIILYIYHVQLTVPVSLIDIRYAPVWAVTKRFQRVPDTAKGSVQKAFLTLTPHGRAPRNHHQIQAHTALGPPGRSVARYLSVM